MSLDEDYPKHCQKHATAIETLLTIAPCLDPADREEIAMSMNDLANEARDLVEITERLLREPHSSVEIGELLIAFQLTLGAIRGDLGLIDERLFDIGDSLAGIEPSETD